jgi:hypothetical protein
LFLAMAHAQSGNTSAAKQWYDKAAAMLKTRLDDSDEIRRFHLETEEILGLATARELTHGQPPDPDR